MNVRNLVAWICVCICCFILRMASNENALPHELHRCNPFIVRFRGAFAHQFWFLQSRTLRCHGKQNFRACGVARFSTCARSGVDVDNVSALCPRIREQRCRVPAEPAVVQPSQRLSQYLGTCRCWADDTLQRERPLTEECASAKLAGNTHSLRCCLVRRL